MSIILRGCVSKVVRVRSANVLISHFFEKYDAHNFLVIFTAAFTPIPYKVFSITAGVFQINLSVFIIASILGRGGRFVIIGLLIRFFGEPIKAMMDKHFNTFIIVLTIIFALSYILVGYLF